VNLYDITTYASVAYAIIGGYCFKSISSNGLRALIFFLCIQVIADLFLIYVFPIGNGHLIRVVYSILKPIEYGVYGFLFYERIRSKASYYYVLLSTTSLCLISGFQWLIDSASLAIATNIILIEGIFVLVLVLLYFRTILLSNSVILLFEDPLFWIATGLLFFYTGNIVATGFYHQLMKISAKLAHNLYLLNYTLNLLNYLLSSIAFVIASKSRRPYVP
jgi:hypothetical protein